MEGTTETDFEEVGFEPSAPSQRSRSVSEGEWLKGRTGSSKAPSLIEARGRIPLLPPTCHGSNPCTFQSGYWLVGIVDWPNRAGLPGVAHESVF